MLEKVNMGVNTINRLFVSYFFEKWLLNVLWAEICRYKRWVNEVYFGKF